MSRGRHAAINYIVLTFKEVVMLALGFVSRGIFIKQIGIEYIGVMGIFSSIISMISLLNMGYGKTIVYIMVPAIAQGDKEKVEKLYYSSKKVFSIIVVAMALAGVLVMPFIKYMFKKDEIVEGLYIYYLIYLATSLLSYFCASQKVVFSAYQKVRVAEMGMLIGSVTTSMLQIALMVFAPSFIGYLLLGIVGNLVTCGYIQARFKKEYSFEKGVSYRFNDEEKKQIRGRVKDVFTFNLASSAISMTDSTLISRFSGVNTLGCYENYNVIFSYVKTISKNAYNSMESGLESLNVLSKKEEALELYKRCLFGFHCIATVMITCCFALTQDFMTIFAGSKNLLSINVVAVILVDMYINIILYALTCCFVATDFFSDVRNYYALASIVNIILSVTLVLLFGFIGVFWGTLISRVCIIAPGTIYVVYRKIFGEKMWKGYLINIGYFLQFVAITALIVYCARFFDVYNYFQWAIKAMITFVGTLMILLVLNLKNRQFKFFWKRYVCQIWTKIKRVNGNE